MPEAAVAVRSNERLSIDSGLRVPSVAMSKFSNGMFFAPRQACVEAFVAVALTKAISCGTPAVTVAV